MAGVRDGLESRGSRSFPDILIAAGATNKELRSHACKRIYRHPDPGWSLPRRSTPRYLLAVPLGQGDNACMKIQAKNPHSIWILQQSHMA